MKVNPNFVLEDCPIGRVDGISVHGSDWSVQKECCEGGAQTVYVEDNAETEKAEGEQQVGCL